MKGNDLPVARLEQIIGAVERAPLEGFDMAVRWADGAAGRAAAPSGGRCSRRRCGRRGFADRLNGEPGALPGGPERPFPDGED